MKNLSFYVPLYSLTLLLSAALLFSVQPMFSKMILPLLGGTPQVWNTAMLFFQVTLLAGYAYAHGTTKYMSARAQSVLHIALLVLFIFVLPFGIPDGWVPPHGRDPTLWQLSLMTMTIGGPFFVLAASAPMFQRWFAESNHPDADNPYFLYAASNLGSMTALLAYPVIIEPYLNLSEQSYGWMLFYVVLVAMAAACVIYLWKQPVKKKTKRAVKSSEVITWKRRLLWVALAFVPSSLMLGVTTFITTDIAAVPLLWILPLALYVGTFIIVFAKRPPISFKAASALQGIFLILLVVQKISYPLGSPFTLIFLHLSVFFFSALTCHSALVAARPSAARLTEFYLLLSVGGALGGVFNAIIAPHYFIIPFEYGLVLVASSFARHIFKPKETLAATLRRNITSFKKRGLDALFTALFFIVFASVVLAALSAHYNDKIMSLAAAFTLAGFMVWTFQTRWLFGIITACVFIFHPLGYHLSGSGSAVPLYQTRNYFGVLRVVDTNAGIRYLSNGTTNHGAQITQPPEHRLTPISYYSEEGPFYDVMAFFNQRGGKQEIGTIGLGIGGVLCYPKPGRHFDFFEINKAVLDIARNTDYFTFLSDCGSPHRVILGDGRLMLLDEPDQKYDLFVVDAFTSDNIPVHLLTREAIALYFQKMKENGVLLIHISNRYLDLEPVLQKIGEDLGIGVFAKTLEAEPIRDTGVESYPSHWVVLTNNERAQRYLDAQQWSEAQPREGVRVWTDQYSNILSVFGNKAAMTRMKKELAEKAKASKNESTSSPEN